MFKTLVEYITEVEAVSNPEGTILSVIQLIKKTAEGSGDATKFSMPRFLNHLKNAGLDIDYAGFKGYYDASPSIQNSIGQFTEKEISFGSDEDSESSETMGKPEGKMPPAEKVAQMANRAVKARESASDSFAQKQLLKKNPKAKDVVNKYKVTTIKESKDEYEDDDDKKGKKKVGKKDEIDTEPSMDDQKMTSEKKTNEGYRVSATDAASDDVFKSKVFKDKAAAEAEAKKMKSARDKRGGKQFHNVMVVSEKIELDEMSDAQMKKREEIVKSMKKKSGDFKKRYGDRAKDVMYATATKMAMKEGFELGIEKSEFIEEVELDEAKNYEIKNGKIHISKANFRKVHKDYKNSTKGKERMMALDPKSGATTSYEVVFEEVELDEVGGAAFGGTIDKIQKVVDDKTAMKIDGVMVDTFTASLIMNIFKKVNKQNQDKMRKMKVTQLANAAYKLSGMKEEVELDEAFKAGDTVKVKLNRKGKEYIEKGKVIKIEKDSIIVKHDFSRTPSRVSMKNIVKEEVEVEEKFDYWQSPDSLAKLAGVKKVK